MTSFLRLGLIQRMQLENHFQQALRLLAPVSEEERAIVLRVLRSGSSVAAVVADIRRRRAEAAAARSRSGTDAEPEEDSGFRPGP